MDHISIVGESAGKVWHALNDNGPQTLTQLKKKIGGSNGSVEMAIGWLAREGKVEFDAQKRNVFVKLRQ